ncbi:hypothetical protein ACPSL3_07635 [Vibrio owensii]|uniref:hypothetical protein n=1 Tax=Vibrio owensii TaxID=696485 RepID=UPI003CE47381
MKSKIKIALVAACSLLVPITASAEMVVEGLLSKLGEPIKWIDQYPGDAFIQVPWSHALYLGIGNDNKTQNWCVGVGSRGLGSWNEGSANGSPDRTVTLKRIGGTESVQMDIKYKGAEWLLHSAPTRVFANPHISYASQGATQKMTLMGNIAYVANESNGFMADECFGFDSRVIGVKAFRPVIEIDPANMQEISDKFATGTYPKGIYEGTANFEANWKNYYYVTSSVGSWTTTVAYKGSMKFRLFYEGDRIQSIVVTGQDVIVPDTVSKPGYVQGKTEYNVEVQGVISNGVIVTLAKPNSDFSLKPVITKESETNKIPYSLYCRECDGSGVMMVENGKAVNTTGRYGLVHNDFRGVEAHFEVSFTDKLLEDLYNDTYLGSFTLLFELDL